MCLYTGKSQVSAKLQYYKASLLRLKPSSARLPRCIFNRLRELGLLKARRGRRSGSHVHRKIPVFISPIRNQIQHLESPTAQRFLLNVALKENIDVNDRDNPQKPPLLPRILLTNARSLNNKFDELHAAVLEDMFDIVAITET